MPSVERDHDMLDGEHQDQDESSSSESEQGSPPQPDPDMVELTSEDHARCFIEHEDRLFHSSNAPYPLPVDTYEQERQNLMHKMCHRILGEHYYGPVPEVLVAVPGDVERRVLDLGTGTGKWAMDMGKAFRQSRVTGVDIVPIQTKEPWKNVWFEIEDIRKQLRWGDEAFDLVHARDLSMGISDWPALITEVARLLRSGGLFISCEWVLSPVLGGERDPNTHAPASMRFFRAVQTALLVRGVNLVGTDVGRYLQDSQIFRGITTRPFFVGVGEQPQNEEASVIGHDLMTILQTFTNSITPLLRGFGLTELQVGELIADYLSELQNTELRLGYVYFITYARKI